MVNQNALVLSLFPGIDLLGRGFELEGFCVVRGPDKLWGGDVRDFHTMPGKFTGVIGGPPCQDFSSARRTEPTGEGLEMLAEFLRIVTEAKPDWFLIENVCRVPDVTPPAGYTCQRFNLNALECGLPQNRLRSFQFGSLDGAQLVTQFRGRGTGESQRACMATEGRRAGRRTWAEFCELQGLPADFELPSWSQLLRYKMVGNGVPIPMAQAIAKAIKWRKRGSAFKLCACLCGRPVHGKAITATPACRKRMERWRNRESAGVTVPGPLTLPLPL